MSHADASKGKGLSVIQSKLDILTSQTIAIGDGASDVPTMRYAGLKVSMENAEPELKAVANYIAPSVENDGVVDVIERYILKSKIKS
ncbi:MAG: HAD hydrolase family protein [Patescibacteria group bacterium]|nr:HAD hydrolase family protein [Patescibacteria group bacterium]